MKFIILFTLFLILVQKVVAIPTTGILPQIGPIIIQIFVALITMLILVSKRIRKYKYWIIGTTILVSILIYLLLR